MSDALRIVVEFPAEIYGARLGAMWAGIDKPIAEAQKLTAREVQRGIQKRQKSSRMWRLRESWTLRHFEDAAGWPVSSVFSRHIGARLREFGHPKILPGKNPARTGPNRGKPTRALAIPIGSNALRAKPLRPVDFDPTQKGKPGGLFAARSKKGNLILFQKATTFRGAPAPMFLLVRSTTVRGRHDVRDELEARREDFARHMRNEIAIYLESAAAGE